MPITALVLLLAQLLPTIVSDIGEVSAVLDASSTAVKNAQAGDGTISAADWAAIDAATNVDFATLAAAAGMTPPATV